MDVQQREVKWYRQHGLHPERISRSGSGCEYVIGDWAWLRSHGPGAEQIEAQMREAGLYRALEPKRCADCREVKQPREFYVKANGYLRSYCKDCVRAQSAKWRREHPKGLRLVS